MRPELVFLAFMLGCSDDRSEDTCGPIGCDNGVELTMSVGLDDATLLSSSIELCRNEHGAR